MSKRFPHFVFDLARMERNNTIIAAEVTEAIANKSLLEDDHKFANWNNHVDFDYLRQDAIDSVKQGYYLLGLVSTGSGFGDDAITAHYNHFFYLNPDKQKLFQLAMDIGTKAMYVQLPSDFFN